MDEDQPTDKSTVRVSGYNSGAMTQLLVRYFLHPYFLMVTVGAIKHQMQLNTPNIAYWTAVLIMFASSLLFPAGALATWRIAYMLEKVLGFNK